MHINDLQIIKDISTKLTLLNENFVPDDLTIMVVRPTILIEFGDEQELLDDLLCIGVVESLNRSETYVLTPKFFEVLPILDSIYAEYYTEYYEIIEECLESFISKQSLNIKLTLI